MKSSSSIEEDRGNGILYFIFMILYIILYYPDLRCTNKRGSVLYYIKYIQIYI